MTLILFDIDGTLLHPRGCGVAATRLAMQEVFGTVGSLESFRFGGKTDWQMLLETLEGVFSPESIAASLERYDHALAKHLHTIIGDYAVQACEGAAALVEKCLSQGLTVGLLTANMPQAAAIKLRQAGFAPEKFAFGVYGSEAPHRNGLPPLALERARRLNRPTERVVVIGDTPEDIACARVIGARMIAVATGRYSLGNLAAHQPDVVLENLADTNTVFSLF